MVIQEGVVGWVGSWWLGGGTRLPSAHMPRQYLLTWIAWMQCGRQVMI